MMGSFERRGLLFRVFTALFGLWSTLMSVSVQNLNEIRQ